MTTTTEILTSVIELAEEKPDTVAECRYFNGDKTPCCIVGHAFEKHGITADTLEALGTNYGGYDELNNWTGIGGGILSFVGIEDDYDDDAYQILSSIQASQDRGNSWGDAVATHVKKGD